MEILNTVQTEEVRILRGHQEVVKELKEEEVKPLLRGLIKIKKIWYVGENGTGVDSVNTSVTY